MGTTLLFSYHWKTDGEKGSRLLSKLISNCTLFRRKIMNQITRLSFQFLKLTLTTCVLREELMLSGENVADHYLK